VLGDNRFALRACFEGRLRPLIGEALFLEYEDVMGRTALFRRSPLSGAERKESMEAFLSVCEWVSVYFSWRPNMPDESDNHVMELAVAGGAALLVTRNLAGFEKGEVRFPQVRVLSPTELKKEMR
jgi:predicted nucleic acid-binding protein